MLGALELAVDGAELARIEQAVEREHLLVHFNPRYATVIVSPPLVIEEAELDDGMHRLEAALTR